MNMKKYTLLLALLLVGVLTGYSQQSAYLFVYFTGNRMSEEAIRMAVSPDGYNYYALNGNQPVIDSREISSTGGVRDPHILRCEDGKTFYMVVTTWSPAMDGVPTVPWTVEIERSRQLDLQHREYPEEIPESGRFEAGMGTANYL